jgi:hypothetical protein
MFFYILFILSGLNSCEWTKYKIFKKLLNLRGKGTRWQLQHRFHDEWSFYSSYEKTQKEITSTCWVLGYATMVVHIYVGNLGCVKLCELSNIPYC